MSLTNCILARATLVGNYLTADYNGFYPADIGFGSHQFGTSSSPFQTVAGGNYYLANSSPFRGAGTNNIDPGLLAELQTTTTEPPNTKFVNQTITTNTNLGPWDWQTRTHPIWATIIRFWIMSFPSAGWTVRLAAL